MPAASNPPAGADPAVWHAPGATGPADARLCLPGSKSMTNRALVLATLAEQPTVITAPLRARDTQLMVAALRALGTAIDDGDETWRVTPGLAGQASSAGRASSDVTVDVGNAGTVIRFVPPVAALTTLDVSFRGDDRASQRPAGPLLAALRELGAVVDDRGHGAVPFTVRGAGRVSGGAATLDASASSQLVSGLLLSAPRFDKGAEIRHDGPRIPSAPHIAMTVAMLRDAGAEVDEGGQAETRTSGAWRVHPGTLRPGTIRVEPDLSNAAPFLAAALVTGGSVTIAGWPARSAQPGAQILGLLAAMGASYSATADGMRVTGSGSIYGLTADLGDVPELVPVLAALAALADSPSVLTGIGHMRAHETDRLAALAGEIGALGGDVTEREDGLEIRPRPLRADGTVFDSHDDHRLVMAAAVLGLAAPGLRVGGAATVGKTFPGFTGMWSAMLENAAEPAG